MINYIQNKTALITDATSGIGKQLAITLAQMNTNLVLVVCNLNKLESLKNELQKYKLIVTFNVSSFDVPFINKTYPGILPDIPNFDLRTVTRRLGLTGGLKKIEKKLGINRDKIIDKFNGGDAVTLWRMYKATGDDYYINLLIEYNEDDIINLKKIAEYCVGKMKNNLLKN